MKAAPWFDGATIREDAGAHWRLKSQLERVEFLMRDSEWHSLEFLATHAGGSEASVSARLRDLRKPRFGGYEIERWHRGGGFWVYRLVPRGGRDE